MGKCIYSKKIDKSTLVSGFTIPKEKWEEFEKSIGTKLSKGEKSKFYIWLGDKKYSAIYTNVNLDEETSLRTVYQIRYSNAEGLLTDLKNIFSPNSDEYDSVTGKIDILEKNIGELEFKCYPEIIAEPAVNFRTDNLETDNSTLRFAFNKILNGYIEAKKEPFADHSLGNFFRNDVPTIFYNTGLISKETYLVKGSVGQGVWATIPWICIFDRRVTVTATKGIYIVYLLSQDGNSLYLTFNQGCTDIKEKKSKKETIELLHNNAEAIRKNIDSRGFNTNNQVKLGNSLTTLAQLYQEGVIFYKEYKKGNIPNEDELKDDLDKMLKIYKDYVTGNNSNKWWPPKEEYDPNIKKQTWIDILSNKELTNNKALNVLARYYDNDGQASISQLVNKYGSTENYYKSTCIDFAKKLIEHNYCHESNIEDDSKYLAVLFLRRESNSNEPRDYIWRLRSELKEALNEINISRYLYSEEGEVKMSTKETLEYINKYIASRGFTYDYGLIENFFLCLKSKPFVILAGTSGTGKTRLVRLFAEAIGANTENQRYKLVSVRPDWSDSSDLFGHVNLNGKFIPGPIIDFIKKAEADENNPYFLCLDEMNLARVEYYFSDILSIIETREFIEGKIVTDPIIDNNYYGSDNDARNKYGLVRIPENLYIIGTVNMDETTFPFSRKVLDRANTIEFSTVKLLANFTQFEEKISPKMVDNSFMKADYVFFAQCSKKSDYVEQICAELEEINKILGSANAHVGYRVRDEIVFYMLNNDESNLLERNVAFDYEIMQKILPRIQGSSTSIKNMLCELFKHCAGDYEGYQTENDNISAKMLRVAQKQECKYKESAKKIAYMVRRFEEDGFTAYWL